MSDDNDAIVEENTDDVRTIQVRELPIPDLALPDDPRRSGDPLFFCDEFDPMVALDHVEINSAKFRSHFTACDSCRLRARSELV